MILSAKYLGTLLTEIVEDLTTQKPELMNFDRSADPANISPVELSKSLNRSGDSDLIWEPHLKYWQQILIGELPMIELPFDRPRPFGVTTYKSDRASRMLPKALANDLVQLSQTWGSTLFSTLLTALMCCSIVILDKQIYS